MSESYKDASRSLKGPDNPRTVQFGQGTAVDQVWQVNDTVPREHFKTCPVADSLSVNTYEFDITGNDNLITWTNALGVIYEIRVSYDGGAVSGPSSGVEAENYRVCRVPATPHPASYANSIIKAVVRSLPFVSTAVDPDTLQIAIIDERERSTALVVTGDAVVAGPDVVTLEVSRPTFPAGYRVSEPWARCKYLRVVDAWITGMDDQNVNIAVSLQSDIQRLSEDFDNVDYEDEFAYDNTIITFPYGDDSKSLDWSFRVPLFLDYIPAPHGQPHPLFPNALLVEEHNNVSGGFTTVSRKYRHIAPVSDQAKQGFSVTWDCYDAGTPANSYPVVTIRLDVLLSTFTPAIVGSTCPLDGIFPMGVNAKLDFSALKQVKPPNVSAASGNNVWGTAIYEYQKIPSFPKTTWQKASSPKGHKLYSTSLYVDLTAWSEPDIGAPATIAGFGSNFVTAVTQPDPSCIVAQVTIDHTIVPAGTFTEWGSVGYNFPALYPAPLTAWPPSPVPFAGGRDGWGETTPCKIELTFTRNPTTETALMPTSIQFQSFLALAVQDAIQNNDLSEADVAESVASIFWRMSNILHDQILIEDPSSGAIVVTSIPSIPSAQVYRNWISTKAYFLISDTLQLWMGDIYVRTKVSVKAR